MRLIDADAIEFHGGLVEFACQAIIDQQPTVDAEPVRHGRWIKAWVGTVFHDDGTKEHLGDGVRCSLCMQRNEEQSEYCPHCGAKMDEEAPHVDP